MTCCGSGDSEERDQEEHNDSTEDDLLPQEYDPKYGRSDFLRQFCFCLQNLKIIIDKKMTNF